jgi:hypothetical protein
LAEGVNGKGSTGRWPAVVAAFVEVWKHAGGEEGVAVWAAIHCCAVWFVRVGRPVEERGRTGGSRCDLRILMRAVLISGIVYKGVRILTRYASLKRTRSIVRL